MIKRKKPLKRTPIKRKPYKIKKVSDKAERDNKKYNQLREEYFKNEENKYCKAQLECFADEATDVHHMEGRGSHLLDTSTWLPVCRKCHQRITDNSKEAIQLGLSKSRLKNAR